MEHYIFFVHSDLCMPSTHIEDYACYTYSINTIYTTTSSAHIKSV